MIGNLPVVENPAQLRCMNWSNGQGNAPSAE